MRWLCDNCSPSHSKDWGKIGRTDEPALQRAIELVIIMRAEREELRNTVGFLSACRCAWEAEC